MANLRGHHLAYYDLNDFRRLESSRIFLIGSPLFFISVFCFGFVLLQPQTVTKAKSAASQPSNSAAKSAHKVSEIPLNDSSNLPKLSEEQTPANNSSASGNSASSPAAAATMTNPQTSSGTPTSPQQAKQNSGKESSSKSGSLNVAQPLFQILGL